MGETSRVRRSADAAERQFNAAARAIIIDKHLACTQFPRQSHLPRSVTCPYTGHQPVLCAVCDGKRLFFRIKRNSDHRRTENFLLRSFVIGIDVGKKDRCNVVTTRRCIIRNGTFGGDPEAAFPTPVDKPGDQRFLFRGDEWAEIEIVNCRTNTQRRKSLGKRFQQLVVNA